MLTYSGKSVVDEWVKLPPNVLVPIGTMVKHEGKVQKTAYTGKRDNIWLYKIDNDDNSFSNRYISKYTVYIKQSNLDILNDPKIVDKVNSMNDYNKRVFDNLQTIQTIKSKIRTILDLDTNCTLPRIVFNEKQSEYNICDHMISITKTGNMFTITCGNNTSIRIPNLNDMIDFDNPNDSWAFLNGPPVVSEVSDGRNGRDNRGGSSKRLPFIKRTVAQLRLDATKRNIKGRSTMNKAQLITALQRK